MNVSRRRPGSLVRLGVLAVLGVAVGVAGFFAIRVLTAPGPRAAEGWALLEPMPNARGEIASAVADGRLYVVGGMTGLDFAASTEVSVYDPATGTWSAGPALPDGRHHAAAAALDGSVYLCGGAGPSVARSEACWVLEAGEVAWRTVAPMPEARYGHRMVDHDGRLFVVGGTAGPRTNPGDEPAGLVDGSVLIYDPAADAWSAGAPIPLVRDHLAVVVVNNEIWAIGGRAGGPNHARVDIYDPVSDAWRPGPALPIPTSGAAEAVIDGVIYLSGGEDPPTGSIMDRHWRLDPASISDLMTDFWAPMPVPPLAVHGAAGASLDGSFVVVAGATRAGGQSNTAWTGALQRLLATPPVASAVPSE